MQQHSEFEECYSLPCLSCLTYLTCLALGAFLEGETTRRGRGYAFVIRLSDFRQPADSKCQHKLSRCIADSANPVNISVTLPLSLIACD